MKADRLFFLLNREVICRINMFEKRVYADHRDVIGGWKQERQGLETDDQD
jgi:hypothetical protein